MKMKKLSPEKVRQGKDLVAKISSLVEGGLSPILYHWTTVERALAILAQNKFRLTTPKRVWGDDDEYYYLSTSRAKFGGYHINRRGVIFVLDGIALGRKYKGKATDFFHRNPLDRPDDPRSHDEMEDRILSKKSDIENAAQYIKEIHVCTSALPREKPEPALVRRAADHHIPIYVYAYDDMLSWLNLNKKKAINLEPEKIAAGLSSVLYHWTPLPNAISILKDDRFKLATPVRSGDREGYYYLSTTRSKLGGYHVNHKGVIFVLDGTALGSKHKGEAVDFWINEDWRRPDKDTREGDEMEDRVLSKKPAIEHASKYIKEIHLCLSTNDFTNEHYLGNVREFIALAKHRNIPIYIYKFADMLAWLNQDKRKAMPLEKFNVPVLSSTFNNWVALTDEQIKQEYEWEYISHQKRSGFNPWPTLEDFKKAVRDGDVETLTESADRRVGNRSRCEDIEDLKDLTSGYRFPRDVDRIVKGYKEGHAMPYPIVLEQGTRRWVMSGNTRLDAAFIMGITPKVLVLKVPSFKDKVTSKYKIVSRR